MDDFTVDLAEPVRQEIRSPESTCLDVLLAVMPFGPIFQPSLGASILRDALTRRGLSVQVDYFSIAFIEILGLQAYQLISEYYPDSRKLFGEWIFSHALFGGKYDKDAVRKYLDVQHFANSADIETAASLCEAVGRSQSRIEAFVERVADDIISSGARVVGFTSMFQQQVASLAVAKRVKRRNPDVFVIFGGANVEGPMGLETLRAFPFVDAVVSGPGEIALPLIVESLRWGGALPQVPGVTYCKRYGMEGIGSNAPELPMDEVPLVEFSDFFAAFASSDVLEDAQVTPSVLIEMSRGCWWGQKHHCTFCGLNGATMNFRMKSAERAISDLRSLATKYPGSRIVVTDNIMPQSYYRDVLPNLKKSEFPAGLFFEVKANASRAQIESLADAGVDIVQVGIESFSPQLLGAMKKGVSCIANVAFLKHCATYRIRPSWLLLSGFPVETRSDYVWNRKVVNLIRHLTPPQAHTRIRIDRFSPHHSEFRKFGFSSIAPVESYSSIYRDESINLRDLAYFFEGEVEPADDLQAEWDLLDAAVQDWQSTYLSAELWMMRVGEKESLILDARDPAKDIDVYYIDGPSTSILVGCEERSSLSAACGHLSADEASRRIESLEKIGVLLCEGSATISLPLVLGYARGHISKRLYEFMIRHGLIADDGNNGQSLRLPFGAEVMPGIRTLARRN